MSILERAHQLIEPLDDTSTLHFVYGLMAGALMLSARFEESMVWAQRSTALGEARQYWPAVGGGYYYLSINAEYLGRWQKVDEWGQCGRQFSRQAGWRDVEVWNELQRALAAYYRGDLAVGVQLHASA